jgi:hypothetical protein
MLTTVSSGWHNQMPMHLLFLLLLLLLDWLPCYGGPSWRNNCCTAAAGSWCWCLLLPHKLAHFLLNYIKAIAQVAMAP